MKASWILPDRAQTGVMRLEQDGEERPLHMALDLRSLPLAFTLGIPEELFVADRREPVIFLQFARMPGASLFSASMEAGKDIGGRSVVLTLLVSTPAGTSLQRMTWGNVAHPGTDRDSAARLLANLSNQADDPHSSLNAVLDAVDCFPEKTTFASERLTRTANRPDWMKKKVYGSDSSAI